MSSRPSRRGRDDSGAVLVIVAFLLFGLLAMAAIVIDLGQLRATKRSNQSAADFAALDAGYFLAGNGPGSVSINPRLACDAALSSIKLNVEDFPSSTTYPCSDFPTTATSDICTAGNNGPVTAGPYQLSIVYPVPASDIADARFTGSVGVEDGTPCERMSVSLTRTNPSIFGGVMGVSSQTISAKAVIRGKTSSTKQGSPAFLILERTHCPSLSEAVGGSELGIIVEDIIGSDGPQPGLIHVDSDATDPGCSGSAYAVEGEGLPSGAPSITAETATDGSPGIIAIHALQQGNADRAYTSYPGGLSVQPTPARIVSRKPVDEKYRPSSADTIAQLHAAAYLALTSAIPATYRVVPCNEKTGVVTEARVWVDCDSYQPDDIVFLNATDVRFSGSVALKNGASMIMPVAQEVFIGGGLDTSGGSGGNVTVNSPNVTSCPSTTNTTKLVIFGGDLTVDGNLSLCQTFVYLAGPNNGSNATYSPQQKTSPLSPGNCTVDLPCPKSTGTSVGNLRILGGNILWSAPDQSTTTPAPGSQGVEDLAMWAESSGTSEIKSGGTLNLAGVFFGPNANFEVRSPALAQPQGAQFIVRKLHLFQGTLKMRPVASATITIPIPGAFNLIR